MKKQYEFDLARFISPEKMKRVREFIKGKETPFLLLDLSVIEQRYLELKAHLPFSKVYYAVKANPNDEVITLLHKLGSNFDVATRYELDQLIRLGVHASRISYGNTIKKKRDIKYFYDKGVRLFVTDSDDDLRNIADHAPGSRVFFRILTEGTGADWPLSRKFGSHPDTIYNMITHSKDLGLEPYGISFHVGSQQRDIGQWDDAIARCRYLFDAALEAGVELKMINIGGGFPANYLEPTLPLLDYANEITRFLEEDFGDNFPEIYLEPGRSLTADAGIIVSEIVLVSHKSKNSLYKWVYLDIGMFGGLIETMEESIKYPIYFDKEGDTEEVILSGPTCDSMDILYENYKYDMPSTAQAGDHIFIFTTGAYTQSYSSVYFNGFPPLKAYILPSE